MNKTKTILQVEDDENDLLFFGLAMKDARVKVSIQIAYDGEQAIGYLLFSPFN